MAGVIVLLTPMYVLEVATSAGQLERLGLTDAEIERLQTGEKVEHWFEGIITATSTRRRGSWLRRWLSLERW
jgi:hypothetical protein